MSLLVTVMRIYEFSWSQERWMLKALSRFWHTCVQLLPK
jgi:hypothetical protein